MKENYIAVELDLHQSEFGKYVLSHYDILEEIYRSENSQLFKVRRHDSTKINVLKVIKKKPFLLFDLDGFKRIQHEHIVVVEETGESDYFYYMLMAFIEGSTLENHIERSGPCTIDIAKFYIYQIYQALEYLHHHYEGQFIYRDLKPSNIMVTKDNKIILIDINTIRMKKDSSQSDTYYIGSRGYTAPESYGYAQSTESSDVYSLGATLYFLLTGKVPAVGRLFHDEINTSALKLKYKSIICKATKFNPKDRYQNVVHFKQAIFQPFFFKKALYIISFLIILTIASGFGINMYQSDQMEKKFEFPKEQSLKSTKDTFEETTESNYVLPPFTKEDFADLKQASRGINLLKFDNYVNITYDRAVMDGTLRDFKYISVGTSNGPFDGISLYDLAYGAAVNEWGFQVYADEGFNEFVKKGDFIYVIIFDAMKKPIAYYFTNEPYVP